MFILLCCYLDFFELYQDLYVKAIIKKKKSLIVFLFLFLILCRNVLQYSEFIIKIKY